MRERLAGGLVRALARSFKVITAVPVNAQRWLQHLSCHGNSAKDAKAGGRRWLEPRRAKVTG